LNYIREVKGKSDGGVKSNSENIDEREGQ